MVVTSQKPRSLRKYNSLSPDIRSLLDEPKIEEYRQTSTHSDDDDEHEGNDDEEEDDDFISSLTCFFFFILAMLCCMIISLLMPIYITV